MNPCVALIGNGKSGRYLTWRILNEILCANGKTASFMADSGIVEDIPAEVRAKPYHFPDAERITGVDWQANPAGERVLCYWWPDPDQPHRFDVDLERAVNESHLISGPIWQRLLEEDERMKEITHYVHVIRDGRDQLVSLAHFILKPETQKRWPNSRGITSFKQAFSSYFDYGASLWGQCAMDWKIHEGNADTFSLRYEDLIGKKRNIALALMKFLGFERDESLADHIVELTSVEKSKEFSPDHVRTARTGDRKEVFTYKLERKFNKLSYGMLERLGYKE